MNANLYVLIGYALIVIVGGMIGYFKSGSAPSIIMGTIFGVLLLVCSWHLWNQKLLGFYGALALATILALFFGYRFFLSHNFMPAGLMTIISLLVIIKLFTSRNFPFQ